MGDAKQSVPATPESMGEEAQDPANRRDEEASQRALEGEGRGETPGSGEGGDESRPKTAFTAASAVSSGGKTPQQVGLKDDDVTRYPPKMPELTPKAPKLNKEPARYPDGRPVPQYRGHADTYPKHGPFVHVWPPGGVEMKTHVTTAGHRLVEARDAKVGELVQILPEWQDGSDYERFKGMQGRITAKYGDGYLGVIFETERKEVVVHAGQHGVYMLSYVHPEGAKENETDIVPPPLNDFGKILTYVPEARSEPSTRPNTVATGSRPSTGAFAGLGLRFEEDPLGDDG